MEDFGAGEFQLVFGDKELVVHAGEGVFNEGLVFVGAEEDAHWGVVARGHFVGAIIGDVGVELAELLVREGVDFEVDEDVAFEHAVVEDEVDEVVFVTDEEAFLSGFETEAVAEF